MQKWVFLFIFLSILFKPSPVFAASSIPTVIIHQIRGPETCCQPGSAELITTLKSSQKFADLKFSWALRFDAINSTIAEELIDADKKSLGILLEITPQLATKSGVLYRGNPSGNDWHFASHVFLIGYTQEERKKLIDTAVSAFQNKFNTNPSFSVAWMIDSWSLKYLREKYGIAVHELTKEQYETDNYTLYGGIFNLPYIASDRHPLIPDYTHPYGTLIFRQTISDITKNYGTQKAWYTSQPNDYLSNKIENYSIEYFKKLLQKTSEQTDGKKFAVLGLENSQEWSLHTDEYLRQLDYIATQQKENAVKTFFPTEIRSIFNSELNTPGKWLYTGDFFQSGALWYWGENYRVRFELLNGKLAITDYRVYPNALVDPYFQNPAQVSKAYWVLPYVIDSSQQFDEIHKFPPYEGDVIRQDAGVKRFTINLNTAVTKIEHRNNSLILKNGEEEVVTLSPQKIVGEHSFNQIAMRKSELKTIDELFGDTDKVTLSFSKHPHFFINKKTLNKYELGWENSNGKEVPLALVESTDTEFSVSPQKNISESDLNLLSLLYQPDQANLAVSREKTVVYWHNTSAISGRNAIRLYVDVRNDYNRPQSISSVDLKSNATQSNVIITHDKDLQNQLQPFFFDISSPVATSETVELKINDEQFAIKELHFYPDCKAEVIRCASHPREGLGYFSIMVQEYWQRISENMQKLINSPKIEKGN